MPSRMVKLIIYFEYEPFWISRAIWFRHAMVEFKGSCGFHPMDDCILSIGSTRFRTSGRWSGAGRICWKGNARSRAEAFSFLAPGSLGLPLSAVDTESINNGRPGRSISRYYPGVVVDAGFIGGSLAEKNPAGLIILLDVPFSFCADTILLPVDLFNDIRGE